MEKMIRNRRTFLKSFIRKLWADRQENRHLFLGTAFSAIIDVEIRMAIREIRFLDRLEASMDEPEPLEGKLEYRHAYAH